MILIPVIELLILAGTIFGAVSFRGTLAGWMLTVLVFYQIWMLIRFVKEHP